MSTLDLFGDPKAEPVTCRVEQDVFPRHAAKAFDFDFDGEIAFQPHTVPSNLPETYKIGAIVGNSGTGKSLLLNHFGEEQQVEWVRNKAIVSHFNTPEEAVSRLSAVGLNSIPSWMKPYHVLSVGEAYRANMARRMGDGVVFDEFTSVVDRDTASSCARSLNRIATQRGWGNIVVATCHEDIIPWLQPDWVFDTNTGTLSVGRWLRRPSIRLDIHRCDTGVWASFAKYHYLTGEISKSAHCYVGLLENRPICFAATLALPNPTVKNAWRGHRTVVLPEFQGLGIGPRFSDAIGQIYLDKGCRYYSRTAHPRFGQYRDASPKWKASAHNRNLRLDNIKKNEENQYNNWQLDSERVCWAHEYIGEV